MPKNIVLCFDGTNNQFGENNTNIVKLYDSLSKTKEQVTFYDPGIGTMGPSWMAKILGDIYKFFCMTTGFGISENIKDGYRYLMDNYEENDKIFIFGFSRGAYTARSLAGMVHRVGILDKGLYNQIDYAYKMYTDKRNHKYAEGFKNTYSHRQVSVYLIGVFDTVGSLAGDKLGAILGGILGFVSFYNYGDNIFPIIEDPRIGAALSALIVGAAFYFYQPIGRFIEKTILGSHLFHDTKLSNQVKYGFHALAIDELRWLYKPTLWDESSIPDGQVIEQVWFSGVHVDVGGFYKETASTSDNALAWMIDLSSKAGLQLKNHNWRALLSPKSNSALSKNFILWLLTYPIRRRIVKKSKVHRSVQERVDRPNPWYAPSPLKDLSDFQVVYENQVKFNT